MGLVGCQTSQTINSELRKMYQRVDKSASYSDDNADATEIT